MAKKTKIKVNADTEIPADNTVEEIEVPTEEQEEVVTLSKADYDALNSALEEAKKKELAEMVAPQKCVFVNAKLEAEMADMSAEDKQEFLDSYGIKEDGLSQLVHVAYDTLGLQSYLTAGDKECRAWTIPKGATAPQAAGVIHTDFERGFIAANICKYDDLVRLGSEKAVKEAGLLRTEGKTYIMQDGDVVEFKFNV